MKQSQLITAVAYGLMLQAVEQNLSFTAYDITKGTRELVGKDVPVAHDDIRQLVTHAFDAGSLGAYSRNPDLSIHGEPLRYTSPNDAGPVGVKNQSTLTPVPNQTSNPIVQALTNTTPVTPKGGFTPRTQPSVPTPTQSVSYSQSVGQFRVLKSLLEEAGIPAGTKVTVFKPLNSDRIFISNGPVSSNMQGTSREYTVDSKQNLRVRLASLGAKNYSRIEVEVAGNGQLLLSGK